MRQADRSKLATRIFRKNEAEKEEEVERMREQRGRTFLEVTLKKLFLFPRDSVSSTSRDATASFICLAS